MAKQTFTTGQVLTAAQVNSLQTNDFNQTVNAKTASYVLVASDKGTRIEFNTSGSVTCTVNTGIFDAGDTLIVQNRGAGAVTITAGTATVNTGGSLVVNQYESGTLYFISASAALWFGSNPGDITGITTGASSGLTGGVTSGTADLKFNTTAKGGLLVGTGSGTVTELTVGSNNTVLTADSATASGLKWAAASSSGCTLIKTGTFTNVATTGTTFDGVFTSTYKRYLIVGDLLQVSGSVVYGQIQMRIGASTHSANDYYGAHQRVGSGGTVVYSTAGTVAAFTQINGTKGFNTINISGVGNTSESAKFYGNGYANQGSESVTFGWQANTANSYDGFILSASSGNITGSFSVYGLAN